MPLADFVMRHLPYFCRGRVVHGFGRGSKQLGIPTANFPEQVVDNLPADISTGIYYGWASVGSGDVHKMVVSIGWNPYYKNTKKSMETHIMHTFKEDFYGEILNVAIVGYLRPEKNFDSLAADVSQGKSTQKIMMVRFLETVIFFSLGLPCLSLSWACSAFRILVTLDSCGGTRAW
ncbi:riboflavin kinase isoform X1 [Saimiri boliviensis]|uniref:riboflavin kinase isoform X1 n=1 Tax=Saimiri boliviensis TaxID=27679 RepID=UPI003D781093